MNAKRASGLVPISRSTESLVPSGSLTTATRSSALPGVPSITETAGLKEAAYQFWVGMFVAAKTPRAIVEKLHAETVKVLAMPDVKERLEKLGAAPMPMGQLAFEKFLDDETAAATRLVKSAGIKIE